jgi:membrane protease YdiL (CAAX protease family)
MVAGILALHRFGGSGDETGDSPAMDQMAVTVQVRFGFDGVRQRFLPAGVPLAEDIAFEQIRADFGGGPPAQRQRFAVVAGDMRGPSRALAVLDELERLLRDRKRPLEGKAREVEDALRALYGGGGARPDPAAPKRLSPARCALLRKELGWFGDLALAPPGSPGRDAFLEPARRKALADVVFMGCGALALLLGFAGAVLFWFVVLGSSRITFRLAPGSAPHGVYAEAFAAWMVLFIVISAAVGLLLRAAGVAGLGLAAETALELLMLGALAWPVLRGVPWRTVRDDIGLRLSPTPIRDVLAGMGCWFMGLPVMAAGTLASIALFGVVQAFKGPGDPLAPPDLPTHPIVGEVVRGRSILSVLFLASVVAPFMEEIVFRGLLYRHLRDATGRRGRAWSVAVSALVSGLVFAAIHPQGLVFVPVLASVAWVLVEAREWRSSLLAPMVAHGFHNGVVTLLLYINFASS